MKGTTITLINKVKKGTDELNHDIYEEVTTAVDNVLIVLGASDGIPDSTSLDKKKLTGEIAIPKGDLNDWVNADIVWNGYRLKTVGYPIEGIEANVPTRWHKKIKVEMYG